MRRLACALAVLGACNFPKPEDAPSDANGIDAVVLDPSKTILVSVDGNDANDGRAAPVRTLKHAVELAVAEPRLTAISIGAGRYAADAGESFPYSIPEGMTVVGPSDSSAILAGTGTETGLVLTSATLQQLTLEEFATAISSTGVVGLSRLRITNSDLALRVESTSQATLSSVTIEGMRAASASDCQAGILALGSAKLMASTLATRNLSTSVTAEGSALIDLSAIDIIADAPCRGVIFKVGTDKTFAIHGGNVLGGGTALAFTAPAGAATQATVADLVVHNVSTGITGSNVVLTMTGGEVMGSENALNAGAGGDWRFTNVKFLDSTQIGLYVAGVRNGSDIRTATLFMRDCSVTHSQSDGVYLFDESVADLGTAASPGNNTFQSNGGVGVNIFGVDIGRQIDAVGNTWNASLQGSDTLGHFPGRATVSGPIDRTNGNNFAISSGLSLRH